jgi:hypothetical protein
MIKDKARDSVVKLVANAQRGNWICHAQNNPGRRYLSLVFPLGRMSCPVTKYSAVNYNSMVRKAVERSEVASRSN